MFVGRALSLHRPGLDPILKPCFIPRRMYSANALSGCSARNSSHLPYFRGATTPHMSSGNGHWLYALHASNSLLGAMKPYVYLASKIGSTIFALAGFIFF